MKGIRHILGWVIVGFALFLPFLNIDTYPSAIFAFQFLMIVIAVTWIVKEFEGSPTETIEINKMFKILKIICRNNKEKEYLILEECNNRNKEPLFCKINKEKLPKGIKEGAHIVLNENNKFTMTQ
jgi:hypothetical protein